MKRLKQKLSKSGGKPEQETGPVVASAGNITGSLVSLGDTSGEDLMKSLTVKIEVSHQDPAQTRVELARQNIFIASTELAESVRLCNAPGASDDIDLSHLDVSPSAIAATVKQVLIQRRSLEPGIATKIGGFLGRIYPLASLTLGLGAALSEGTSFLPIKGTINGLSLLYSGIQNADIGELLQEKCADLMTAVIRFLNSAILFFRHDYFYNLGKTLLLGPTIYVNGRSALDQAIAEYDQALLLEVTIKVLTMYKPTVPPLGPSDQQKLADLQAWLQSSGSEVEAQFTNNCEVRAPATLKWILECEEFKNWRLQQGRSAGKNSLWLNGVPGVGKSVIAAYAVEVLKAQHPDAIILYFFCKAGESNLDNLESIVRTMAAQLAQSEHTCCERLQKMKDEAFRPPRSLPSLFVSFIKETIVGLSLQIFVVIDGLDECFDGDPGDSDGPINKFLEGFETLDVKLLISSRPTPEITRALHFGFKKTLVFEDSRDDIENYAAARISRSKNLQKGFSRISKEPGKYVAEKSNGNFLWVSIVLNLLERTPSAKAFQASVEAIPRAIGGVYDKVLDKLEAAGTLEAAMAILECILFSVRPMTIHEINIATRFMSDEILDLQGFIEAECGSFLALVPGRKAPSVHIVHETFRAYITNLKACSSRNLKPVRSHGRIAIACLMSFTEAKNDDSNDDDVDFDIECFRDYAAMNWCTHLKNSRDASAASDNETILGLLSAIYDFLQDEVALREWMCRWVLLQKDSHRAWDLGFHMANIYDELPGWISADITAAVLDYPESQDPDMQRFMSVARWKVELCKYGSTTLAESISNNFTWVWLNTNWETYTLAKQMFAGALRVARILQLAGDPKEEENRFEWPAGLGPEAQLTPEQKQKPGWTWRYPSSVSTAWQVDPRQLEVVATNGGYNNFIGVQAGNYAIGQHFARSQHCVESFRIAIDENPERWYLYEGLGNWYERQKDDANAIKYYEEAMRLDPEIPPSCALDYYTLLADIKTQEGDREAAEEAFRKGAMMKTGWDGNVYWNRMAKLYQDIKDWDNVKRVFREAIEMHPVCAHIYWDYLAKTYKDSLDWWGQLQVLLDSIERDPENSSGHEDGIKDLGKEFKNLQLWEPAIKIYTTAIEKHPVARVKYQRELAGVYLAHGGSDNWLKASSLLETVIKVNDKDDNRDEYRDLARCYLGLGEFSKCHAALALSVSSGLIADDVGPAFMVAGEYQKAIQALKAELTWRFNNIKDYPRDQHQSANLMGLRMKLGLCYEAISRDEDAKTSYAAAVECFEKYADEQKKEVFNREEGHSYHRSECWHLYKYALMLERLGRLEKAKEFYYCVDFICNITTFVDDDDVLTSQAVEIREALKRVTGALEGNDDSAKRIMPDLLLRVGSIGLQRELCLPLRINWYAYPGDNTPRYRGGSGYATLFSKGNTALEKS